GALGDADVEPALPRRHSARCALWARRHLRSGPRSDAGPGRGPTNRGTNDDLQRPLVPVPLRLPDLVDAHGTGERPAILSGRGDLRRASRSNARGLWSWALWQQHRGDLEPVVRAAPAVLEQGPNGWDHA